MTKTTFTPRLFVLLLAVLLAVSFSTPASAQESCGFSICTSTCMEWSPIFFVGGVPMTTIIFYPCGCHTTPCPDEPRPKPDPTKIIDLKFPGYLKLDSVERAATPPAGCRRKVG